MNSINYSRMLGAIVCGSDQVDSATLAKFKGMLKDEPVFGLKYLFVSLSDPLLLADDLGELGAWADFIGNCRRSGVSIQDVQKALHPMRAERERAPSLAGISPAAPIEPKNGASHVSVGRFYPGLRVRTLKTKASGRLVAVNDKRALVRWSDGRQVKLTLKTLGDKRRYRLAP